MVKMKDSGIEWIGEIPETWKVVPLFYCANAIRDKNQKLAVKRALKFTYGEIVDKAIYNEDTPNDVLDTLKNYTIVKKNDIMINGLNLAFDFVTQRVGEVSNIGVITSAYMAIRPNNKVIASYLTYLLKTYDNLKAFHNMGGGVRKILNYKELSKQSITLPPKSEQQQIADYLDHKTTEINGLIDKINAEIDTLQQYQSSVITQAVTKGLDPNVPMKDSGIEWIGEIPEKWETIKIKYLVSKLERGTAPKYTELHETQVVNQATFSKGFFDKSNLRYSTIPASQSRGLLQYQDVLVASTGGGVLGKVHYFTEHEEFVADSHVTIVRFIEQKLIPKFGYYYLSTLYDVFNNVMAQGSTNQIELKRDTFANSFIPFPRIEEQRVIVDYLDQKVSQIQTIIKSKQQQIDQLTEYKNSLIFEYVTGKKQVKEAN